MRKLSNRSLIITVIVLIIINLVTLSVLWLNKPKEKSWGKLGDRHRIERFLQKELALDKVQLKAFSEIRQQHFESTKELVNDMHSTRLQLTRLLSEEPDTLQSDVLIDKIVSIQAELERHNFEHMKKLRNVCNDTQKPKFDSVMTKVINRVRHFRHMKKRMHD